MKKYNTAIIGYGVVGKRRFYYINKNTLFKIKYISDIRFKKNFNKNNIKYYVNYLELLKNKIDVVFVTLPNYLAAKVTAECLKRKIHVFCEKPPSKNLIELKKVIKIEKKNKSIKLMYGFNHRYHDSVREAKKIINNGKYGKIVFLRGVYGKSQIVTYKKNDWRSQRKFSGGGILLDQGIHLLDIIRYFFGDFIEFKSFISNKYWNHDVEDNAFALMRNRAGIIASIHSTATQWQHKFNLEIVLEKAIIVLNGILSGSKTYGKETLTIISRAGAKSDDKAKKKKIYYKNDNSWRDEINEFLNILKNNLKVKNGNSKDAYNVMKMIQKIYKSDIKWNKNI